MAGDPTEAEETSSYAEWQPGLHPTWLSGPWGRAWGAAFGRLKDAFRLGLTYAVKARFAMVAPADALPDLAFERGLERAPGESIDTFRRRIVNAWEAYPWVATDKGIVDRLYEYGLEAAVLRDRGRAWIRDPAEEYGGRFVELGPTALTHDDDPPGTRPRRMWVVIDHPPWEFFETWADVAAVFPTWADWAASGEIWGIRISVEHAASIRRLVLKWKRSAAHLISIVVIMRGRIGGFPVAADYSHPSVGPLPWVAYWPGD